MENIIEILSAKKYYLNKNFMDQFKQDFIELLVEANALRFGEFTLKSGRIAPYFLNTGSLYTGDYVSRLADAYVDAYEKSALDVDVIFGPAYKGIPLAVSFIQKLKEKTGKNLAYAFNRKEVKDHGEGGEMIGAALKHDTKVLIIDDVITAGTAIRESLEILKKNGNPIVSGILISMDRMEKNNDGIGAIKAVENEFGVNVFSIANLDDVVASLYNKKVGGQIYIDDEKMQKIKMYRELYGI